MEKAKSKTEYFNFVGKAYWAKVYQADEFRGAVRWMIDLALQGEDEWEKFKISGIQKKVKEDAEKGKFVNFSRSTTKLMRGKLVYFAPPTIYDKDGMPIVRYVNEEGNPVRSYDDEKAKIERIGEPVLIGNGSLVSVNVSVYPTAMGPGNRLESIRILDLVHYDKPKELQENQEEKGPEKTETEKALNDEIPW